jgi:threonine aldolase
MFEIRDVDLPDHIYGTTATLEDAEHLVEQLIGAAEAQLVANGEGAAAFWLRTAIYRDDGALMISGGAEFAVPPRLDPTD